MKENSFNFDTVSTEFLPPKGIIKTLAFFKSGLTFTSVIVIVLFSMIFAVLGVGNKNFGMFKAWYSKDDFKTAVYDQVEPNLEYR